MNHADKQILDLIGIGVGPFNLGLASLLVPIDTVKAKFFDAKDEFVWHEGLLLEDCHLQVPFLADLVTMTDPTSPYSYLNYLRAHGRLYQFYFYETFQIPRTEYSRYCHWVAQQLSSVEFSQEVIDVVEMDTLFCVTVRHTRTGDETRHFTRNVVLGVGTTPNVPQSLVGYINGQDFVHSAQYSFTKNTLQQKQSITVIGGGQSAAECFLDLLRDQKHYGYELNWLTRSSGFFPMEYSKLGLEHFSPDYIEHFFGLSDRTRQTILATQGNWYKGISFSTIREIYDCLYIRSVEQPGKVTIQARSELQCAKQYDQGWKLDFRHLELKQPFTLQTQAVVLGSGYQYAFPRCLNGIRHLVDFDGNQRQIVKRDYTLQTHLAGSGHIFVQNGEMHTHGISAPDLGLGSYRNATIINTLLGKQHYPTPIKTVFQSFGIAPQWQNTSALTPERSSYLVDVQHE